MLLYLRRPLVKAVGRWSVASKRQRSVASKRQRSSYVRAQKNPFVPSHPPYWKGYCRKEDEALATELFYGRTVRDETGRTKKEYSVQDSMRDRSAREALVRLLSYFWGDDCFEIMGLLRDALKSEGTGERRLVFQFRKKGNRSDLAADFPVAFHVLLREHDRPIE